MINSEDVSEQELETLKGDAVGDNLCSSKWIINTLMSLCEVHKDGWTQELEDRLCMLWDLSIDKEVTSHLVSYDFLKIAENILETSDHSRLIEIVLGIIGNVCCNDNKTIDTIGNDKDLVIQLLNRLMSDDTEVLIQLLRILQSVSHKIEENASNSSWITHLIEFEIFGEVITFLLKSSTNDELLTIAVKLLRSMCEINVEKKNFLELLFKMDDLILALIESFIQLIPMEIDSSMNKLTFIRHWLRVLNVIIMQDSFKFKDYENNTNISKVMDIIYKILRPYEHSYNLFPIRQLDVDVIQESSYVLLNFHCGWKNFPSKLDHLLMTIMFSIEIAIQRCMDSNREELDPEEILNKLLSDLNQYWIQSIGLSTDKQIIDVLHLCEPELCKYLINIAQSDLTVTSEIFEKMKTIVVAFEES